MKKLLLIAVFLLGVSMMAMAQDTPMVEIFGGYSFVRSDTEEAFGAQDEDFDLNMSGWDASVAFNANNWAGFVVDFGGVYGSPSEEDDVSIRSHTIMVGPRFSVRRGKVTPFFQYLVGYAHTTADEDGDKVFGENVFAMAFGGGVDININERISVRPAQVEYLTAKSSGSGQFSDNFRYSAGIVLKLGKR